MKRSKKGKRQLDRRIRDFEETVKNKQGFTCPGRSKMK